MPRSETSQASTELSRYSQNFGNDFTCLLGATCPPSGNDIERSFFVLVRPHAPRCICLTLSIPHCTDLQHSTIFSAADPHHSFHRRHLRWVVQTPLQQRNKWVVQTSRTYHKTQKADTTNIATFSTMYVFIRF